MNWKIIPSTLVLFMSFNTPGTAAEPVPDKRPNILWITWEDMTPDLGCFGDAQAITPNLDKLAGEGLRFTHAFSTSGVCAPSRFALITGMYPASLGANHMRTVNAGSSVEGLIDYEVVTPPEVKCFSEYLREAGYYCTNNVKTDYQFKVPLTAWDECSTSAHYRDREPGQPFFAVFNFHTTHESSMALKRDPLHVDPAKMEVPPYYPDTPVVRRDLARKYSNMTVLDAQIGLLIEELKQSGEYENTIIFCFSDHAGPLPWEKREIYDRGIRVPLIIRLPGGERGGTVIEDLVSFVDFAPTALSLAGVRPPEHLHGRAFLGEFAEEQPRQYIFAARDRMEQQEDRVRVVRSRDFKLIRNHRPEVPYRMDVGYRQRHVPMAQELIRLHEAGLLEPEQDRWFAERKPEWEFYNLAEDPHELKNLAEDPRYRDKIATMNSALEDWKTQFGDLGELPETELIERFWPGGRQPVTEAPVFTEHQGQFNMSSPTEGASIAYRFQDDPEDKWRLYTTPIPASYAKITARAFRIGYQPSSMVHGNL